MLGKKKQEKTDETPANELDKPQTLAELDAMAREKKEEKVMLEDGDGDGEVDQDKDIDHEVTHSDEISVDTDVKKVSGSQRRLWVLVGIASMLLTFGGTMFYLQLEDGGSVGIGAGGSEVVASDTNEEGENDLLPRGTFAYVATPGSSSYKRHKLDDKSQADIDVGASIGESSTSPALQISSNSLVSATHTGSGVVVKYLDKQKTLFESNISSVSQWILIPDGTKLFALIGSSLYMYDTSSGEGGEVAKAFTPSGTNISLMAYARDGSIRQYAKTSGNLKGSSYNITTGKVTPLEHDVIRLSSMGDFSANSLSPDGSSIIFRANINGNETLQLLSLNSFVLRTVYVADSGNAPSLYKWSEDSNNIAVFESGVSPKISNLKVGTLEKEVLRNVVPSAISLRWSDDKKFLSYIGDNKLHAIEIETKEAQEVLSSIPPNAITGWIQN